MTNLNVEAFRKMAAQLDGLYEEAVAASKKGPDKAVSLFKIRMANTIIAQANDVLGKSRPTLGFTSFDEDDLPTASDLSFVVAQYVECAEKVRCENIIKNFDNTWVWVQAGAVTGILTNPPRAK